jgi:outer membrane lipoprotein-sorting protein
MKPTNFLLIFTLLFGALFASSDVFDFPLNEQSKIALTNISQKLPKSEYVQGNFIQRKFVTRLNRAIVSNGVFVVWQNRGILWNTKSPFSSKTFLKSDAIIQTTPSGAKTKIKSGDDSQFQAFSVAFGGALRGDIDLILKHFDVYFIEKDKIWFIGLKPKGSPIKDYVSEIVMSGRYSIEKFVVYETNGDHIIYELSNITCPSKLNEEDSLIFEEE